MVSGAKRQRLDDMERRFPGRRQYLLAESAVPPDEWYGVSGQKGRLSAQICLLTPQRGARLKTLVAGPLGSGFDGGALSASGELAGGSRIGGGQA